MAAKRALKWIRTFEGQASFLDMKQQIPLRGGVSQAITNPFQYFREIVLFLVAYWVYHNLTSNSHTEIAMFSGYSFHIICMLLICSGGNPLSILCAVLHWCQLPRQLFLWHNRWITIQGVYKMYSVCRSYVRWVLYHKKLKHWVWLEWWAGVMAYHMKEINNYHLIGWSDLS